MKALLHIVKKWSTLTVILLFVVMGFTNCNSSRQVAYFQDVPDTTGVMMRVRNAEFVEPVIHKGDILNIEVTTIDPQLGGNITQKETAENESKNKQISGYMVDKNGIIEVPILGKLKIEGMTTMEVKEAVRKSAMKYYKDPMVNVRIANFYITVLGEVRAPGRYVANSEKVSILDAIGMAGDLTLGGKRGNVMIIREENGESVFTRVSMNETELLSSKYYYLQSGDKIVVEPLKTIARSGTSDQRVDRYVSLTLGVVSVMIAIISLGLRLK